MTSRNALLASVAAVFLGTGLADAARADVFTDLRIQIGSQARPVAVERVWVEPIYETRCERVWVEPVYETRCERVWREPIYEERCEQVYVPDRWETRCETVRDHRGRRVIREVRVLVERAHYEPRSTRVLVRAGGWEEIPQQVCVREGHWEEVTRQVVVRDGYWAEQPVACADPQPTFRIEIEKSWTRDDRGDRHEARYDRGDRRDDDRRDRDHREAGRDRRDADTRYARNAGDDRAPRNRRG